jgi:hypothetical protein
LHPAAIPTSAVSPAAIRQASDIPTHATLPLVARQDRGICFLSAAATAPIPHAKAPMFHANEETMSAGATRYIIAILVRAERVGVLVPRCHKDECDDVVSVVVDSAGRHVFVYVNITNRLIRIRTNFIENP